MDSPGPWPELASSPWGICLNWQCETAIDLALDGILGNWWIRDPVVVKPNQPPLPAGVISVSQPSHNESDGTVTAPDLIVASFMGFVYASDGVFQDTLADRLAVHHALFNAFAKRARPASLQTAMDAAFPGVDVLRILCRPGDPSSQQARDKNLAAGWLEVRFHLRYPSTA